MERLVFLRTRAADGSRRPVSRHSWRYVLPVVPDGVDAQGLRAVEPAAPAAQHDGTVTPRLPRLCPELQDEATLVPAARDALGPPGSRGLPSDRSVRMHSVTHPNPQARWYDRVGPLRAVRAWYDHLRGSPHDGTSPKVDEAREYVPGAKKGYEPRGPTEV